MKAPGESSGEKDERKGAETADKVRAFRAPRPKRARGPIKSTLDQLIDNVKENQGSSTRVVTLKELEAHNQPNEAWCAVRGHVFDLTELVEGKRRHPGGVEILKKFAGKDATHQFQMFHYPRGTAVKWASKDMYIGKLEKDPNEKKSSLLANPLGFVSGLFRGAS